MGAESVPVSDSGGADHAAVSPSEDAPSMTGHDDQERPLSPAAVLRIALVAVAAAVVFLLPGSARVAAIAIGATGLAVGGWPILKEAFENLAQRRMTMELSMALAIVAAAAIGELATALVITAFVLVAELLEGLTVSRGRRAIRDLLDLLPRAVSVRRDGVVTQASLGTLQVGDLVLVRPGERVAVDGAVVGGCSFVDESAITGESLPVEKTVGGSVLAGSINQSGALEVRARALGGDTSFGRIIEAVEEAERSRAPVQRLADRLAGWLVYFALGAALLTFLITRDLKSTISVVIVAGACGVAAGTPLAILGAIGRAARAGAIVKGGRFLEQLGRVELVALDKTGTVTLGKPEVLALAPAPGIEPGELLRAASASELKSEHALGGAIVAHAKAQGIDVAEPERFRYAPGRGIDATVAGERVLVGTAAFLREEGVAVDRDLLADHREASQVHVARAGKSLGAIAIADRVRPEASAALATLHRLGIRAVLLTGDTEAVASAVARALGIAEVAAGLRPDEKRAYVQRLVRSGCTVAMVGDGINDAPALVEAHVGIAMGSGTDVARESADVVLLGNDLSKLAELLALARRTRRVIFANFAGTIGVDTAGIALAALGLLNPLLAALIHVTSELIFILNSARLLPSARPRHLKWPMAAGWPAIR